MSRIDGAAPAASGLTIGHRRADIQGLRAIAVIIVVAFHVGSSPIGQTSGGSGLALVPAGFIGVDVFFVVSGFVITAMLLRGMERSGRIRFADFYARRARRLMPALALLTVVVLLAGIPVLGAFWAQPFATRTALAANAFVANVYLYRHVGYFDATAALNPFLHTWSLSIEEQTYLILPIGLAAAAWVGRRVSRRSSLDGHLGRPERVVMLALVGGSSLASFVLAIALSRRWRPFDVEAPIRLAFLGTPARLWEFGVGALLALTWSRLARVPRPIADALGMIGAVILVAAAFRIDPGGPYPSLVTMLPVLGAAMILVAGARSTPVTTALGWSPLVWLGDRSYAWYLWHWPAIVLASAAWPTSVAAPMVAGIASLLPAWASHRFVEQPLRVDRRIVGPSALRMASACLAAVALVAGVVTIGSRSGWGLTEEAGWYDLPNGQNVGCHMFNRDGGLDTPVDACTTSVTNQTGTVVIVGDLQADSVAPAVVEVAAELGLGTLQRTRSGCPYLNRVPVHADVCASWNQRTDELIDRVDPVLVVIANDSPSYTTEAADEQVVAVEDGSHPASKAEALDSWAEGLEGTLRGLEQRGIPTLLVGATPTLGPSPQDRLSLLDPHPVAPAISIQAAQRERSAVWDLERKVVGRHRAAVFDPLPEVCDSMCRSLSGGTWLVYDGHHLTVAGSQRLSRGLEQRVRELLAR